MPLRLCVSILHVFINDRVQARVMASPLICVVVMPYLRLENATEIGSSHNAHSKD